MHFLQWTYQKVNQHGTSGFLNLNTNQEPDNHPEHSDNTSKMDITEGISVGTLLKIQLWELNNQTKSAKENPAVEIANAEMDISDTISERITNTESNSISSQDITNHQHQNSAMASTLEPQKAAIQVIMQKWYFSNRYCSLQKKNQQERVITRETSTLTRWKYLDRTR